MTQPAPTFPLMAGYEKYEGLPLIDVVNDMMTDPNMIAEFRPAFWKDIDSVFWEDAKESDDKLVNDFMELARREDDLDTRIRILYCRAFFLPDAD